MIESPPKTKEHFQALLCVQSAGLRCAGAARARELPWVNKNLLPNINRAKTFVTENGVS